MPVRSSTSSVLKWPSRETVLAALREWTAGEVHRHPGLLRLVLFGSYARGDCGVGSDIDLLAVVERSDDLFDQRGLSWNLHPLPLPAEILVYTREEWDRLAAQRRRFSRVIEGEGLILFQALPPDPGRKSD